MKLLLSILIIPTICSSQLLTQIKTKEQAENFIKENFNYYDDKYDSFVIDSVDSNFDNFKEGDFNHDGIKDLLVFGTANIATQPAYSEDEIVIIIGGERKPRKAKFPYGFFLGPGVHIIPYPKVINIGQKDFILIKYNVVSHKQQISKTFYDTFFVKNDHLMLFTNKPSARAITAIGFRTTTCYGTCPVFELTIHKSLDVEYNGIKYVEKEGEYRLKIDSYDWDYLTELIGNLKIENLKDNYSVGWTDDQTGFLTVVFKDGDKKQIEDYGLSGTFGLTVLYAYLFELRRF